MSDSASGRRVVAAGFVGNGLGSTVLMLFTLGVFTKPIEDDLGWTRGQISLVATIYTLVTTILFPFVGALLDRVGPRRVVLASLPAFAAAYTCLALAPRSLPAFYALWAIIAALGLGPSPAAYAKAIASSFGRKLGVAMGIAVAGQGVGAALMPALAHVLIERLGWRHAYAAIGAIAFVLTFSTCLVFLKGASRPPESGAHADSDLRTALETPALAILAIAFFLLGFMSTAMLSHQVPMLMDAGVSAGRAARVQVVYGVTLTLGRLVVGFALDRFFAPRVLMASLGGVVLGLAGYAVGVRGDAAFVCAALVGFGVGAEIDALGYMVARYFGLRAYGRIYALILSVFTLGGGIGAAVLGALRTARGSYTAGLWLVAAATAIAIVVLSRLRRVARLEARREAGLRTR